MSLFNPATKLLQFFFCLFLNCLPKNINCILFFHSLSFCVFFLSDLFAQFVTFQYVHCCFDFVEFQFNRFKVFGKKRVQSLNARTRTTVSLIEKISNIPHTNTITLSANLCQITYTVQDTCLSSHASQLTDDKTKQR